MKEVAKKVLMKIEKETAKLDSLISKRDELTNSYQEKMAEFSKSIKEQEKIIADLREQEKLEKLEAIADLMNKNGVTVNDLYSAVSKSDLYGIQEILESGSKTVPNDEKPDATVTESVPTADTASASETDTDITDENADIPHF